MPIKTISIKLKPDSKEAKAHHILQDVNSSLRKHILRKNIFMIKILKQSNIRSNDRYIKLIIQLTILIINYSTTLVPVNTTLLTYSIIMCTFNHFQYLFTINDITDISIATVTMIQESLPHHIFAASGFVAKNVLMYRNRMHL
jgi:hypothetical protein